MASTVPVNSRSLHNLSLQHVKWKREESSSGHQQRPRSLQSPSRKPSASSHSPRRRSPLRRDSVAATPAAVSSRDSPVGGDYSLKQCPTRGESSRRSPVNDWMKQWRVDCDSERRCPNSETEILGKSKCFSMEYSRNQFRYSGFNGIRTGVCSSDSAQAKKKSEETVVDLANKRSKILIKIPCKNSTLEAVIPEESPLKMGNCTNNDQHHDFEEEKKIDNNIDEEVKKWNLRPRRPVLESKKANVSRMPEKYRAHPPLMNANKPKGKAGTFSGAGEKKEKRTLSISVSLSKEEIEEDIYSLTGSKPARKPKKRAKQIQRQLDFVFPGLWLVSVSRDSYKVSTSSLTV